MMDLIKKLIEKYFTEEELREARDKAKNTSSPKKMFLIFTAIFIGVFLGAFLLFQVLFLYKVLPHGGIW